MGWIKERIEAEKRKHGNMPNGLEKFNLDWARLAEAKIIAELKLKIDGSPYIDLEVRESLKDSLFHGKEKNNGN